MAVTLHSSIAIAAPRAAVWAALTDTASYPSWNPYYVQVQGAIAPNATLRMQVSMDSSPRRTSASFPASRQISRTVSEVITDTLASSKIPCARRSMRRPERLIAASGPSAA